MNIIEKPLGNQRQGAVVEVTLQGTESDVFLVDTLNLSKFKRGQDFRYSGGHYNSSPVRLAIPSAGTWTAVVVPGGGSVSASFRMVA
ncbi:MAG: DUF1883 domain-containing protein [Jatrophihabitantaceae bacterium]